MPSPAKRHDPVLTSFFKVTLKGVPGFDGTAAALFRSVTGLKSESEVVDYREGGLNGTTHKLVGPVKWPNLVLKRGLTKDTSFIKWRAAWLDESTPVKRVSGTVSQLAHDLSTVMFAWDFTGGWPCLWEGPEYDASKGELAIETLEIAHDGLTFKG